VAASVLFNVGLALQALEARRVPAGLGLRLLLLVGTGFAATNVEPLVLREQWASATLSGAPIAVGLLIAALGTILLTRTRAVSTLIAGQASGSAS
jgi:hypothetical protein